MNPNQTPFIRAIETALKSSLARITLPLLLLAVSQAAWGQATGDYRSAATGNWNATATWERYNGSAWVAAVATPTSADGVITIRSPHVVTITATVTYDQVIVDGGAQVTVASGVTTTMNNGSGTDLTINGTWLHSGGTWTVTGASWTVGAGGTYIHNTTASAATPIGVATLDAASTWIYRGSSTLSPPNTFSGRTYGNLVFESTSGAWTIPVNTGTSACTINGSLSFGITGAGTVSWTLAGTVTSPFNISGNLSIGTGSSISLAGIPITLNGNLTNNGTMTVNSTAGTFTFNGASASVAGSAAPAFAGGCIVNSGKAVTLSQGLAVSGGTATVNGTLNCGTSVVSGAGNFTLASGATLGIGDAAGITSSGATGNVQVSGTRTFSTSANYVYNGTVAQATGSGLPSTVNDLTVSNTLAVASGGVTLSGSTIVNGTLGLTLGRLITSANQMIIADAGAVSGGTSGSYVDGNLQKVWATTGTKSFTFPVGAGAIFAPCSVSSLVLTAAGNLTASTTGSEHANLGSSTIDSSKSANRSWTMTAGGGLAVSTYNASCTFVGGDLDGGANSANFVMEKWNGSSWTRAASSSVSGNTVTGNGFASLSDFAVGEPAAVSTDPAGVGAASPAIVGRGNPTLLTVTVTPGTFPTSTGLAVTANLSAIGGSSSQQFYDDNSNGDVTGGDNVFSFATSVTTGTTLGAKSLPATIIDSQSRTGNATISVTVAGVTRTWAGSGPDDNWSTGSNWGGGVVPISPEDSVTFTGSTRLTPALDSSTTVSSLVFDSGASSFTLGATGGSTLTLNGGTGLTNNSANAQSVNVPLVLGSAQTFNATGAGTLTIANTVNNGGNLLTSDGANNSVIAGPISGGGGLAKAGSGTLTLAGTNSYGGATTLSAGTLSVAGGEAIPDSSAVTLANASGVTLSLAASETVGSLSGGGASGGTVALGANNLTVGGTTTYSGPVTGTGKLIKAGAGTLTLNNAGAIGSSFSARVEGGTVDFNRGGSSLVGIIGSGNTIELAGGTLQLSANVQASFGVTFSALDVFADSTFHFNRTGTTSSQSPSINAPLNFKNNAKLTVTHNASITNGTHTFAGITNTLEGHAAIDVTAYTVALPNPVVEAGGSWSLTKLGPGILNLEATNTYSGGTSNLAGTIALNDVGNIGDPSAPVIFAGGDLLVRNSRPNNPIANPIVIADDATIYGNGTLNNSTRTVPLSTDVITTTAGALTVRNAATAAGVTGNVFSLRLTGGGFDLTQPVVVGHAGDLAGYSSQLEFYSDDTKADQIVSGVISGSGSIIRNAAAGGGRTILTGANTYAGTTTVTRGTLLLNNTSGSGTSTGAVSVATAGVLGGTGTVAGVVTVGAGGTLAPGSSIGTLTLESEPGLGGTVFVEIDRNGGSPLADKIVFNDGATLSGTLTVTNVGLAVQSGDTFDLFDGAVGGTFATLILPPGGLVHWKTNNLVVDGTITFTNTAPLATNLTLGVLHGESVTFQIIGGKNAPTDADGDSLTVTGVSAPTSGTSSFTSSTLTYVASGSTGTNTFTYTVSDGLGGSDTKTVTVVVSNPQGFNLLTATAGEGNAYLTYLGIPGTNYALEVTHDLPTTNWTAVMTNTAAMNGYVYLTNQASLFPTNDYYRTRYVP